MYHMSNPRNLENRPRGRMARFANEGFLERWGITRRRLICGAALVALVGGGIYAHSHPESWISAFYDLEGLRDNQRGSIEIPYHLNPAPNPPPQMELRSEDPSYDAPNSPWEGEKVLI